jgi:hypothetical protein
MVNNSTIINKRKERLNSDGQQLILVVLLIITVQTFLWFVDMVELLTITVKTFFCFVDIGRIVDHHSSNFLLV